ncbi:unnamed protein product [Ambrosiozyma monospora]|uniref:Unnamed protein product n=1 Tax=Ambrosiozyma monospora TaxID=43982 RepID=A0ACB5T8M0_AMBMO|nr:unnamed protein product [Ambrosiozyma monospora]
MSLDYINIINSLPTELKPDILGYSLNILKDSLPDNYDYDTKGEHTCGYSNWLQFTDVLSYVAQNAQISILSVDFSVKLVLRPNVKISFHIDDDYSSSNLTIRSLSLIKFYKLELSPHGLVSDKTALFLEHIVNTLNPVKASLSLIQQGLSMLPRLPETFTGRITTVRLSQNCVAPFLLNLGQFTRLKKVIVFIQSGSNSSHLTINYQLLEALIPRVDKLVIDLCVLGPILEMDELLLAEFLNRFEDQVEFELTELGLPMSTTSFKLCSASQTIRSYTLLETDCEHLVSGYGDPNLLSKLNQLNNLSVCVHHKFNFDLHSEYITSLCLTYMNSSLCIIPDLCKLTKLRQLTLKVYTDIHDMEVVSPFPKSLRKLSIFYVQGVNLTRKLALPKYLKVLECRALFMNHLDFQDCAALEILNLEISASDNIQETNTIWSLTPDTVNDLHVKYNSTLLSVLQRKVFGVHQN